MALSAFDNSVSSLESRSDSLSAWLFWFTLLVVLGLVVEYGHVVVKLFKTRPFEKELLLTIIGGVLITIGVAGELVVQSLAARVESGLRSKNSLIEAGLIKEADDAKREAAGLERNIAAINLDAAKASERASKAEMGAARSLAVAERERLERVRLEAEVSPRRLSPEQRNRIAAACRKFAGRKVEVVSIFQGDVEAAILAQQIAESLTDAGLDVKFFAAPHLYVTMHIGIEVNPQEGDTALGSAIAMMLVSDGKLEGVELGPASAGTTFVAVGSKPIK